MIACFLLFLQSNDLLHNNQNISIISNDALASLTLFIASSKPESLSTDEWLKGKGIKLAAKPLGRPSAKAVENHVSPGERNPIEGEFGQAKTGYGMNRIKARLIDTSQSWIASIILVLNLIKLAGIALLWLSFSAWATFNYVLIAIVEAVYKSLETKNQFRLNYGLVLRI